jgi:hypothetical protein
MNLLFPDSESYKLLSDCIRSAGESVLMLNKINKKRKAMNSKDNAPISNFEWTDELVKEFYEKWHGDRHYNEVIKDLLPKAISNFKSQHSSSGKEDGKDWAIEMFSCTKSIGMVTPYNFTRNHTDGLYYGAMVSPQKLDSLINHPNYQIHSVRRLSDKEVFSIGDEILHREGDGQNWNCKNKGDIIGFSVNKLEELAVGFMPKGETSKSGDVWRELINIKKTPQEKPVLFTTDDGKEIREGDEFFAINSYDFIGGPVSYTAYAPYYKMPNLKYFSSEKKANEYILQNRPVLSLNDVEKCIKCNSGIQYPIINHNKLKELAQSRITP